MFHLTSENAIRKIIYYAEWKETFTVPVTQAIRLEQGGVQLPTAIAGELSNMTLPLMNMGKGELRNVLVKLEIDGVLDAQSVLVGTVAAGETKQAKLIFTPKLDSVCLLYTSPSPRDS